MFSSRPMPSSSKASGRKTSTLSKEGESIHGWTQQDNTFPCCTSKAWMSPRAFRRCREIVAKCKSPLLRRDSIPLQLHPLLKDHGAGDARWCSSVLVSPGWEWESDEEEC